VPSLPEEASQTPKQQEDLVQHRCSQQPSEQENSQGSAEEAVHPDLRLHPSPARSPLVFPKQQTEQHPLWSVAVSQRAVEEEVPEEQTANAEPVAIAKCWWIPQAQLQQEGSRQEVCSPQLAQWRQCSPSQWKDGLEHKPRRCGQG
jgi:hypothetical protein